MNSPGLHVELKSFCVKIKPFACTTGIRYIGSGVGNQLEEYHLSANFGTPRQLVS